MFKKIFPFGKLPKGDLYMLSCGVASRTSLKKAVKHCPDIIPYLATLNPYRADQFILAAYREYNPKTKLEDGNYISHAEGKLTSELILKFLKEENLPLPEEYITLPDITGEV